MSFPGHVCDFDNIRLVKKVHLEDVHQCDGIRLEVNASSRFHDHLTRVMVSKGLVLEILEEEAIL